MHFDKPLYSIQNLTPYYVALFFHLFLFSFYRSVLILLEPGNFQEALLALKLTHFNKFLEHQLATLFMLKGRFRIFRNPDHCLKTFKLFFKTFFGKCIAAYC